jgi:hypothetical protein
MAASSAGSGASGANKYDPTGYVFEGAPYPVPTSQSQRNADALFLSEEEQGQPTLVQKGASAIVNSTPVGKAAEATKDAAVSVGGFLGDLANGNTWIRVGEVLFGSFLLIVGIDRITDAKAVSKVVKSGALL